MNGFACSLALKVRLGQLGHGLLDRIRNETYRQYSKWFEPRSISSSYWVIVRVRVVLKRTVVGD